jgi:dTMP kinase
MPTGLFITLEGGDGSGKSTQIKSLLKRLQLCHITTMAIREPGGTPLGERLRQLLKFSSTPLTPEAELLLFNGSRAQLAADVIQPALERGEVVLCDRFADSTLAYQGYGRGISLDIVQSVNRVAIGNLKPDLTIFLDLSPEEGIGRRSTTRDRFELGFEQKGVMDFHQRVRQGYLELAGKEPERWLTIDALLSAREISRLIWQRVEPLVGKPVHSKKPK